MIVMRHMRENLAEMKTGKLRKEESVLDKPPEGYVDG